MSRDPKHSDSDVRSLLSEWKQRLERNQQGGAGPSEEDKAAALREYQRLVRQIDEVLREQEAERRSGARSDPE